MEFVFAIVVRKHKIGHALESETGKFKSMMYARAYMELGFLWSAFVSLAACVRIHYSNILWSFGQRSTVFVVTLCARLLTFIFRRICGFHSNGKKYILRAFWYMIAK